MEEKKSILLLGERLQAKYKSKKATSSSSDEDEGDIVPERATYTDTSKVQEPKPQLEKREPVVVPSDVWQALELYTRYNIEKCREETAKERKKQQETRDDY